jgi:hypothetical protein
VIIDNNVDEPPEVTLLLQDGAHINGFYSINVVANDENGIDVVSATIDGTAVQFHFNPSTGLFTGTVDTTAFTDGTKTLAVTVTDMDGETTTISIQIVIDNTGPSIDVPNPGNRGRIVFETNATDSSDIKEVLINIDGSDWTGMIYDGDKYVYILWSDVSDNGEHFYSIKAVDELGNERTISGTFQISNPAEGGLDLLLIGLIVFIICFVILLLLIYVWFVKGSKEPAMSTPPPSQMEAPPIPPEDQAPSPPPSEPEAPPSPPEEAAPPAPPKEQEVLKELEQLR